MLNLIKSGTVIVAPIFAYWLGLANGENSEEVKHFNLEISALNAMIQEFKTKLASDFVALAQLRDDASARRSKLDRMRCQLSKLERKTKSDADRERDRRLAFGVRCQDAPERATRAVKFCRQNHK
ncbi:hypothetical protein [Turicimonas sp. TL08]